MHAQSIMSLKDISFKSLRQGDNLFYNKSLNNILVNVVPWRDIIYFLSDIFLGVCRCISSLPTDLGQGAKSLNSLC